jgi:septal ring factor EnvC (AmiA/AmiB activator)
LPSFCEKCDFDFYFCSEQISHQIESKQTWIVKCQQTISQLERQVNEHKSEKLQLEAKLQQRSRLVEQKIELTTANERLELEVQVSPVKVAMFPVVADVYHAGMQQKHLSSPS